MASEQAPLEFPHASLSNSNPLSFPPHKNIVASSFLFPLSFPFIYASLLENSLLNALVGNQHGENAWGYQGAEEGKAGRGSWVVLRGCWRQQVRLVGAVRQPALWCQNGREEESIHAKYQARGEMCEPRPSTGLRVGGHPVTWLGTR